MKKRPKRKLQIDQEALKELTTPRQELEKQGYYHKNTIIMLLYTLINNFYEPMLRELKEQFPEAWNHIMEMSNKGMWTIEQTMRDLYQDPEMQEIIQREMELWSQRGKKQDA